MVRYSCKPKTAWCAEALWVGFSFLVVFGVPVNGFATPFRYNVVDLGTLAIGTDCTATGINAKGHVAGNCGGVLNSSFFWDGDLHPLGTINGFGTGAQGINDADKIVGAIFDGGHNGWFLYDGMFHDLGASNGGASDINSSDQIVGTQDGHAFLYDGGLFHDLGALVHPDCHSVGNAINASGKIVGGSACSAGLGVSFIYDGAMHDLGVSASFSEAEDLNDSGAVVGYLKSSSSIFHAYLWDGTTHDLGTLGGDCSQATAINSTGVVVGLSTVAPGGGCDPPADYFRGFVYTPGVGMEDLNDLIDPGLGLRIYDPHDINDSGEIVAGAIDGLGNRRAVVLTPRAAPEPVSLALLACGIGGIALIRDRRRKRE